MLDFYYSASSEQVGINIIRPEMWTLDSSMASPPFPSFLMRSDRGQASPVQADLAYLLSAAFEVWMLRFLFPRGQRVLQGAFAIDWSFALRTVTVCVCVIPHLCDKTA